MIRTVDATSAKNNFTARIATSFVLILVLSPESMATVTNYVIEKPAHVRSRAVLEEKDQHVKKNVTTGVREVRKEMTTGIAAIGIQTYASLDVILNTMVLRVTRSAVLDVSLGMLLKLRATYRTVAR